MFDGAHFTSLLSITLWLFPHQLNFDFIRIGANVCLCPMILVDMLGVEMVNNSYGIISFFNGVGALIGPPILSKTKYNPTR